MRKVEILRLVVLRALGVGDSRRLLAMLAGRWSLSMQAGF